MPFLKGEAVPEVLFVDVTFPDAMEAHARLTGHLTPSLLRRQLQMALENNPSLPKPSLPKIVAVHMSPAHQDQLERHHLGEPIQIQFLDQFAMDGRLYRIEIRPRGRGGCHVSASLL